MKKIIFIVVLLLLLLAVYFIFSSLSQKTPKVTSFEECVQAGYPVMESYPRQCRTSKGEIFTEEIDQETRSRELAEEWILTQSPTYTFDGYDLQYQKTHYLRGEHHYEFVYTFQSSHGGYGNRTGEIVTEVITAHTITVEMEGNDVTRVIIDSEWDDIVGDFWK